MRLWSAIFLVLGFISCQGGDSHEQAPTNPRIEESLAATRQIEEGISRGFLLTASTSRDVKEIKDLLFEIKVLLMRLQAYPGDGTVLNKLYQTTEYLRGKSLQSYDREAFKRLFSHLDLLVADLVAGSGQTTMGLLFAEEFDDGLGTFQDINIRGRAYWEVEEGGTYTEISGFRSGANENWLISPYIDLKDAEDPRLVIRQTVGYFTQWDDMQVLISYDFKGDSPEKAEWQPIEFSKRPDGSVFWQWVESEEVGLSQGGKGPFVLGLRYLSTEQSAATWQVDFVKIVGKGRLDIQRWEADPSLWERPQAEDVPNDLVFEENFDVGLGSFSDLNLRGQASWMQEHRQDDSYARISGFKAGINENWLLSPIFDLSNVANPRLQIRQKIGYYTKKEDFIVMVSSTYRGGGIDPTQWQPLSLNQVPEHDPGRASPFSNWIETEELDLNFLKSSPFVIGFVYSNDSQKSATWQVDRIRLFGEGPLTVRQLDKPPLKED